VYDMYHWDQPGPAEPGGAEYPGRPAGGTAHHRYPVRRTPRARRPVSGTARPCPAAAAAVPPGPAARAVQVALDRRDNGGDSGAPRGK
jgi:hypothetical protein